MIATAELQSEQPISLSHEYSSIFCFICQMKQLHVELPLRQRVSYHPGELVSPLSLVTSVKLFLPNLILSNAGGISLQGH